MKPSKSVKLPNKKRLNDDDVADFANKAETETQKTKLKPQARKKKVVNTPEQPTIVRDSFTMPDYDYKLIQEIKERFMFAGVSMTKGEILRAGLHALLDLPDTKFKRRGILVDKIKTGRPKQ
jgi:hypothetical protein